MCSDTTVPVLVIEDEPPLARIVRDYLIGAGYDVTQTHNGPDGLRAARELDPDLVVLDLGLPGLDGVEVCREIRTFSDCYIIMLTARSDEIDKLLGLGVGADDYLTKPFSPRELLARTQAALRRPRVSKLATDSRATAWHFQGLTIDTATREVVLHEAPVSLTRTEFDILATIAACPRRVYSRRHIIDAVWGAGWGGDEHIVDVHVAHLRRKLGDDPLLSRYVDTVRGVGYRFVAEPVRGPGR
ncbi:response regulator transcription factor [uncultured Gordonia sp.]|uniref:response regulator transcription factor n=1 Tax=Gordonia sp. (in: high G+C Gram-positive bacteria) TaxID=84139 RepID=UPI000FA9EE17|nr:response regulator transcription factor [uncultured Gordonia sp.]RUP38929.1 MAG: response regulator transcription factor [Gordonia sp. (in: high G+C Gram-positive bacteria)]HNP57769.1 response regulator transcription factor [Gordonia sp. (in: high G+C Gram-positive bacteria)]